MRQQDTDNYLETISLIGFYLAFQNDSGLFIIVVRNDPLGKNEYNTQHHNISVGVRK